MALAERTENAIEADLARGARCSGNMAVWQRTGDGQGVVSGRDDGPAVEHIAQTSDL